MRGAVRGAGASSAKLCEICDTGGDSITCIFLIVRKLMMHFSGTVKHHMGLVTGAEK
jgi:hypothetical protein